MALPVRYNSCYHDFFAALWWWNFIQLSVYVFSLKLMGTLYYKIVNWIPYNYFKIYIAKKAYIWIFTIVENYYCGVFTDLTTYNRLQYHNSISRAEHVYSISTFNTHAPDIKQGVGRVQLHSDKHNIPPFFELLVRLRELQNRMSLINSMCMQMPLNVLWKS